MPPGNQLSAMFVPLANDRLTPLERLRTVTASSASCKGQERAVGYGPMATLLADAIPPALAKPVIQLGVRSGVLRKLRAGNLMISNVPGPGFPLYFAGMELRAVHPLGPVVDGVALNITVQSYRESLFVGINACAMAVPDLGGLARAMVDELSLLSRMAAGAGERRSSSTSRRRRTAGAHVGSLSPAAGGAPGLRPGGAPGAACARVARCNGQTSRVAPSRSHRDCSTRCSSTGTGPGASSRSRPTTGPTTRPRTPTGARPPARR